MGWLRKIANKVGAVLAWPFAPVEVRDESGKVQGWMMLDATGQSYWVPADSRDSV